MKSKLKTEVKAIVAKWKGLIDYLKEEDKRRPLRVSKNPGKSLITALPFSKMSFLHSPNVEVWRHRACDVK